MMTQNLLDFALDRKKRKIKTKSFCLELSRKSGGFLLRTNHSPGVVRNMGNLDINNK